MMEESEPSPFLVGILGTREQYSGETGVEAILINGAKQ
jgi:hypothetical protein